MLFVVTPEIIEHCLEPPDLLRLHCQSLLRACGFRCGRACARGSVTGRAISWLWEPKRTPGEESNRETQHSSDPISGLHRSGLVTALCSYAGPSSYKGSPPRKRAGAWVRPSSTRFSELCALGGLRSTRELKPT